MCSPSCTSAFYQCTIISFSRLIRDSCAAAASCCRIGGSPSRGNFVTRDYPWVVSFCGKSFLLPHVNLKTQIKFEYCKFRIFRTHSIFVIWALRPFVRMKFCTVAQWPLRIFLLALYLSHAFYFRTEVTGYKIYENNMLTKYSGFTVGLLGLGCTMMYCAS